jgi:hypothetical protein
LPASAARQTAVLNLAALSQFPTRAVSSQNRHLA